MNQRYKCDLSVYRDEISRINILSRRLKDIQCSLMDKINELEQQKKESEQKNKDDFQILLSEESKYNKMLLDKVSERLFAEKQEHQRLKDEFDEYRYQNYLISKSGLFHKIKYSWQRYWLAKKSGKSLFLTSEQPYSHSRSVLLTDQPIWLDMDVSPGDKIDYYASVDYQNIIQNRNKALLLIQYIDANNEILKDVYGKIPFSIEKNANFYYLQDSQRESVKILSVTIPSHVAKIRLGFCSFYNFINEYVKLSSQIFYQRYLRVQEIFNEYDFVGVGGILVTNHTINTTICVKPAEQISLYGMVNYSNVAGQNDKKALLLISYFDSKNKRLENVYGKMPFSEQKQANFYYLADSNDKVVELATLRVPENASYLQIGISGFGLQENERIIFSEKLFIRRKNSIKSPLIPHRSNLHVRNVAEELKSLKNTKVAIILDEFSYNSFKDTFTPIAIEPNNWQEIFEKEKPDIFFCESAWSGIDSKVRPWRGQIYASINFPQENRVQLLAIIDYCKKNGIPTVFWNKEDPTHFTDRVHDFVKTAQLFDYVFTTANECVESYKNGYGIKNVYCLPFATNPKLFNPIEKYQRSNDVIFAGSWYQNHIERSEDMVKIFDAILNSNIGLVIHDRYYGDSDPLHKYPEKYLPHVKPNVPFKEIDKVYKGSIFGLNINTVKQSETMFARRVFELMSSNTLVLSNYSKGIQAMFDDNVVLIDNDPQILRNLTDAEISRIREENLQNVLANHTYRNRFKTILDKIGFKYINDDSSLTVCCILNQPKDAELAVKFYRSQLLSNSKLLLIVSTQVQDIDVAPIYTEYNGNNVEVISLSYINKYGKLDYKLSTSHYAFVDYSNKDFDIHLLENALLHAQYLENEFILLCDGDKYKLSDEAKLENVMVKAEYFEYICQNYGTTVKNKFYSLKGN